MRIEQIEPIAVEIAGHHRFRALTESVVVDQFITDPLETDRKSDSNEEDKKAALKENCLSITSPQEKRPT